MGPAEGLYRICRYMSAHNALGRQAIVIAEFLRATGNASYSDQADPDFFKMIRAMINRTLIMDYCNGEQSMRVFKCIADEIENGAEFVARPAKNVTKTGLVLPDDSWVSPPAYTDL